MDGYVYDRVRHTRVSTDRSPSHVWGGSTATPPPCTATEVQPALCKKAKGHLLCIFCIDSLDPSPTPPTPTKKEKEKEIPKHKKHPLLPLLPLSFSLFTLTLISSIAASAFSSNQQTNKTIPISFQKKPFSFPR